MQRAYKRLKTKGIELNSLPRGKGFVGRLVERESGVVINKPIILKNSRLVKQIRGCNDLPGLEIGDDGSFLGDVQVDEFWGPGAFSKVEAREGDGEVEALWASAAGVDVEHAFIQVFMHTMGVSGDDDGDFGEFWVEIDIVQIMEQVNERAFEFDGFAKGKLRGPFAAVGVATHGENGSNGFELVEDGEVADVSSVDDSVGAL